MANVKWIKISTDIFDNWKIKTIKSMPEGHKMVCIWVQLLCIAGARNEHGMIIFPTQMCTTDDILSMIIGEDKLVVQMALDVFTKLGMIQVDDDNSIIQISNWEEYQSVSKLDEIKQYEKERKAKYREKQKQLPDNGSKEEKKCPGHVPDSSISISISNIVNYLNNKLNSNYKSNTNNTVKHITARLKEGYTEEDFYMVIDSKVFDWGNDPKMKQYLRPDTLFGTKFESYLQNAPKKQKKIEKHEESIEEEKEPSLEEWMKMMGVSEEDEV